MQPRLEFTIIKYENGFAVEPNYGARMVFTSLIDLLNHIAQAVDDDFIFGVDQEVAFIEKQRSYE